MAKSKYKLTKAFVSKLTVDDIETGVLVGAFDSHLELRAHLLSMISQIDAYVNKGIKKRTVVLANCSFKKRWSR
jgi:hypothetical protein